MDKNLQMLVDALPECYQPIFGYDEAALNISRGSTDRLDCIVKVYKAIEQSFNRPLKVLDLGCAQGYFSLHLAKLGATVTGIDYLRENVEVCQALARENPLLKATFYQGHIEEVIPKIQHNEYDLILGLSVFHHIIYQQGFEFVNKLMGILSQRIAFGVFELACASEPLYWASAQKKDTREVLVSFPFCHEIGAYKTHLSEITRPIFIASHRFWYFDGEIGAFDEWHSESHQFANGAYAGTRRYFFNGNQVIKQYLLEHPTLGTVNKADYEKEVAFLLNPVGMIDFKIPQLFMHGVNHSEAWVVEERIQGVNFSVNLQKRQKNYDSKAVILSILKQLMILQQMNLYHNDVRVWNIIETPEKDYRLIDFSSISSAAIDTTWPHHLLVSFILFIYEVLTATVIKCRWEEPHVLNLKKIPLFWSTVIVKFFSLPQTEWDFQALYGLIANQSPDAALLKTSFLKQNDETILIYKANSIRITRDKKYINNESSMVVEQSSCLKSSIVSLASFKLIVLKIQGRLIALKTRGNQFLLKNRMRLMSIIAKVKL